MTLILVALTSAADQVLTTLILVVLVVDQILVALVVLIQHQAILILEEDKNG